VSSGQARHWLTNSSGELFALLATNWVVGCS
jgi:hypothetical protein